MGSPVRLDKVGRKLSCSDGQLPKVKELIDCEMRLIDIQDLTTAAPVDYFLNSLFNAQGEYASFVKEFPLFFLLKSATFHQVLPLSIDEKVLTILENTRDTLASVAQRAPATAQGSGTDPDTSPITNSQLLDELEKFLVLLPPLIQNPGSSPPSFPKTISTFRFAEEIIHSVYFRMWTTRGPNLTSQLDRSTTAASDIENFLVTSFRVHENLYQGPELAHAQRVLARLAGELLQRRRGLFVSIDSLANETFLTLPVSKQRTGELLELGRRLPKDDQVQDRADALSETLAIKSEMDKSPPDGRAELLIDTSEAKHLPVLSFNEEDLSRANPENLFFYDYVLEALGRGEAYACDEQSVDAFMGRGIQFMLSLIESVIRLSNPTQSRASRNPSASPHPAAVANREISHTGALTKLREKLILHGLSDRVCATYRTILSLTPPPNNTPWSNYRDFFHLVNQLTLFGSQFYSLLTEYSPTSISIKILRDKIPRAAAQFTDGIQGRTGILTDLPTSDTGLVATFRLFQQSIPEDTLTSIYVSIPYPVVRMTTATLIKRQWGLRLSPDMPISADKRPNMAERLTSPTDAPSYKQVEKYCQRLEVGSMAYDAGLVWSEHFPRAFVTSVIRPTINSILANAYQKNRALFLLRWMSTFAANTNRGLDVLRGQLAELYFFIKDIMEDSYETVVFTDVLDTVRDIYHQFGKLGVDEDVTPIIPTALIEVLFGHQYWKSAEALMESLQNFVNESEIILDGLAHMVALGDALCHRTYEYELGTGLIKIAVAGEAETRSVSIKLFKNLVANLEKTLREGLSVFNQFRSEINQSYLVLLQILSQLDGLSAHVIKIQNLDPDFQFIHRQYIQLFDRVKRVVTLITESCAYSLSARFSSLFAPHLLETETVRHILEFKGDSTLDTNTLVSSLGQPLLERGFPAGISHTPPLNPKFLNQIGELVDLEAETQSPIKVEYSAILNATSPIVIDWNNFTNIQYLSEDKSLHFRILTLNEILSKIFPPVTQ